MNRIFTMLIAAAMVLGVAVGWAVHQYANPDQAKASAGNLSIVTDVFLRLIKMIIAPLVFSTLVAGIAHMEDAAAMRSQRLTTIIIIGMVLGIAVGSACHEL